MSWSWGGMSSLFAGARDPRIDALVEMDGSIRYYPGLVQRAGGCSSGRRQYRCCSSPRGISALKLWPKTHSCRRQGWPKRIERLDTTAISPP